MIKKPKDNGHNGEDILEDVLPVLPITEIEAIETLLLVAQLLGWQVLLPHVGDDEQVPGLIVGTKEYITWISGQLTETEIPQHLKKKA